MGKKRVVKFEELKAGEEVEIRIKAKILEVDHEDGSIRIERSGGGGTWFYGDNFGVTEYRVPKRPIIPEDARVISIQDASRSWFYFTEDGQSWTSYSGTNYTREELVECVSDPDVVGSLKIYDQRV